MPDNDECKEYNSTGHLSCELCINSPEMATALETIDSLHSGQCDKERLIQKRREFPEQPLSWTGVDKLFLIQTK